eukprot:CAMPEP_0203807986 /NCGR_PEP_ID=MMETSP0115-20131106/1358_1 /ASSEMBLY_ACC=CAM_ASM_000227 /TAXON_ID=33651 /ORGANISM="Bicosoecid sp, Strain ms1" /LENGTH=336 /DNA_ID=CAMNT_0050716669 /DNA_START=55 /DNA_END=1065 /DNA_ORIENTATION=-
MRGGAARGAVVAAAALLCLLGSAVAGGAPPPDTDGDGVPSETGFLTIRSCGNDASAVLDSVFWYTNGEAPNQGVTTPIGQASRGLNLWVWPPELKRTAPLALPPSAQAYDAFGEASAADDLAADLALVDDGSLVVITCHDECTNLNSGAGSRAALNDALVAAGSSGMYADTLVYRDAFVVAFVKGGAFYGEATDHNECATLELDVGPDDVDNCPEDANPYQQDDDADGEGNVCDDTPCLHFNRVDDEGWCVPVLEAGVCNDPALDDDSIRVRHLPKEGLTGVFIVNKCDYGPWGGACGSTPDYTFGGEHWWVFATGQDADDYLHFGRCLNGQQQAP